MTKIYYAITPTNKGISNGFTRYANEGDYDHVYDLVMTLIEDPLTAINASSWCELACVGEKYEHEEFIIEIIED